MQHRIPADPSQPHRADMARAVATCVHCGFCLPACPTYRVLGEEMDSPRGRIVLMKQVLEGELTPQDVSLHVDRCLGCLGCVTACPSGVQYGELLVPFRGDEMPRAPSAVARARRRVLLDTLESPALFRASAKAGLLARLAGRLMPASLRPLLSLLPQRLPRAVKLPAITPAQGRRRARVALLAGCAQQVLAPDINVATIRVLAVNGIEVVVPREQACCGALALHAGDIHRAHDRAAALVRAFPSDVDAIITNAAGCGSAMKEYGHAFRGRPDEEAMQAFSSRVRDVSEFLDAIGLIERQISAAPQTVAYHDACHLSHAQGIRSAPRRLLARVPGVRLVEVPDGEICCGSAGLYNVEHAGIASALGRRKAEAIAATDATVVAAGNIGCLVQIDTHLRQVGVTVPVLHTMQVIDRAYAKR